MVKIFNWNIRVYFEDTDSGGVVYHSNYLKFMERGRTEWLRNLGLEQAELRRKEGIIFVVSRLSIDYKDELVVKTKMFKLGASTIFLNQNIVRGEQMISTGHVEIACLNDSIFKPKRIPKKIKQLMETL
jgi:acyl-CoA thioester hydrolase